VIVDIKDTPDFLKEDVVIACPLGFRDILQLQLFREIYDSFGNSSSTFKLNINTRIRTSVAESLEILRSVFFPSQTIKIKGFGSRKGGRLAGQRSRFRCFATCVTSDF